MTPVKFKEANYVDSRMIINGMPVHEFRSYDTYEYAVSCNKLNLIERLRILFTGKIWAMRLPDLTILSTKKNEMI